MNMLRRERNRSVHIFSTCLLTQERNETIAYRSISRIAFLVVLFFGTQQLYLKCFRLNATLQCSTFGRIGNEEERSRSSVNGALGFKISVLNFINFSTSR